MRARCMMAVLGVAGVAGAAGRAEPITTGALIHELIDLRRLAEYPSPAYRTVQFSSYDRRSSVPGGPDWFANSDGFGGEPIPNFEAVLRAPDSEGIGEYLVCDAAGPGALVRTWTAGMAGTLRVVLDEAASPLYDGPAHEFLLCPYRELLAAAKSSTPPFDPAVLDGTLAQHEAAYCPIPFARRCRITWTGPQKEVHFYHIGVRLYEPGAQVQTFVVEDLRTYADDIRQAARVLVNPDREYAYTDGGEVAPLDAEVKPGTTVEPVTLKGPGLVERLMLRVEAADLDRALRQTILHVVCDGWPQGQVEAPLGDFFGAAPGINPCDSLLFTVRGDGSLTCRLPMPFRSELKIRLDNRGEQPVRVSGDLRWLHRPWDDERSMHLRARWRVSHGLRAMPRGQDLPLLVAGGQGVYVGTAVMLLNPSPVPTPWGSWWGEGDEKIFVDGDRRPSTFGTGSEDYFNYAWSIPDIFTLPYCGQPRNDGPGNRGFVTNYRWHVLDPLPFRERLAFYIELMSHEDTPGMSYARIAYHYGRPGLIDDHELIRDEDVRPLSRPAKWQPAPRFAVHDAKFHAAEELAGSAANTTLEQGDLFAGGQILIWQPGRVEGGRAPELPLRFSVAESRKYALHVALLHDGRSGEVSFRLDGKPLPMGGRDKLDLNAPHRAYLRQYTPGEDLELAAGEHVLAVVAEGAKPGGIVGIDYLGVQPK